MQQGVRVSPVRPAASGPRPQTWATPPPSGRWIHPRFRQLPPPVIVIGMHRSGTSLVAGMLHRLGVYMGPELHLPGSSNPSEAGSDARMFRDGYAEAQDFVQINDRLLMHAGARWCSGEPFVVRRDQPWLQWRGLTEMGLATHGALRTSYLRSMEPGREGPWGWKDPRSSLTLPYWLQLFPRATVVHVRRSEAAVVASLVRRALTPATGPPLPPGRRMLHWLRNPARTLRRAAHRLATGQPMAELTDPCRDPELCVELSRTYVRECLLHRERAERFHEIWYEDVVADPDRAAEGLASFLELDRARVPGAAALVQRRALRSDTPVPVTG